MDYSVHWQVIGRGLRSLDARAQRQERPGTGLKRHHLVPKKPSLLTARRYSYVQRKDRLYCRG